MNDNSFHLAILIEFWFEWLLTNCMMFFCWLCSMLTHIRNWVTFLLNVNPSPFTGFFDWLYTPIWGNFSKSSQLGNFLISQKQLRVSTWNFAPVNKIYLRTFLQNSVITWPRGADVSVFVTRELWHICDRPVRKIHNCHVTKIWRFSMCFTCQRVSCT